MRKKLLLFMFVFAAVCLTGCLREGIDTIALPFGKIPEGVIPQEIREQFEQYMPIYEGVTPPDITGEYLCDPDLIVYTSDGQFDPGHQFAPLYFSFYNQTASGMAAYKERQAYSYDESPEVYVVGSGNNFTAYFISTGTRNDQYGNWVASYKMSNVISGTVTEDGITNYKSAFIMLEKDDPDYTLMDVNEYRVFEDGDGIAVRYDWTKTSVGEEAGLPDKTQRRKSLK